jgi:broad specificity phosphatase PhoE
MKPKRVILVRHGESQGNVDRTVYERTPDYKLELTELGVQQAEMAGSQLRALIGEEAVHFYVSPYARTRQTYEGLLKHLAPNERGMIEEPRLREQDWGHLRSPDESARIDGERDAYGPFYYRIQAGESGADVYDRISTFLESLHRDFKKSDFPDNAVIVTHGMLLRLFLMRWLHWRVEYFHTLKNPPNCFFAVLERNAKNKYDLVTQLPRR